MTCRTESDMKRRNKLFEFDIYTYPADGSPKDLTAGYTEERAISEHAARREVLRKAQAKGLFVYSLNLADTHADGGALCLA